MYALQTSFFILTPLLMVCFSHGQKENIGDLVVLNAQLKHAGRYTCTAQTVVDSASESAMLVVRGIFFS